MAAHHLSRIGPGPVNSLARRLRKTQCTCAVCQRACQHTPGWFRPGEAEKAATLLGLPFKTFFRRYLGVQWWEGSEPSTFALAPALVGEKTGHEYPYSPKGTCVFFTNGRCTIHAAKPYECSHGNPCQPEDDQYELERKRTVALWKRHQGQIVELLGRKPREADGSPLELMLLGIFR